ncbi:xanthine dehydrogenase family protein molybdopterin-binding subunit [Halogeometricum sp. S1BR25-6]|uniref:Xanthine dehydrogenase family protein molybdopterin-binding subunit n=1 Tax=Halogeometricum salsisoli TaxID=2950536 RepID=A0ABU2GAF5_9EURY|nr:xanthine dehydrogenase family protein molybdopterin-binding subunit [Halogeometricum sp. S1BR25-6]MDS0297792.1 xanthine dehydrogenase family protein molybdopterin-binding subunit [Halogeometricum sp. S1BR25-6]
MSIDSLDPDDVDAADILGSAIERREDPSLLTGDAEYTDDIQLPEMLHMTILRSQHGHAEIEDVDTSAAEEMDGVVAVYTHDDVADESVSRDGSLLIPTGWLLDSLRQVDHPVLAKDRVRYQGDAIAVVVAEDRYVAHDATDAIDVSYDRLDASADPEAALDGEAGQLHDDAEGNVAFDWEIGDEERTEEAFDDAAHTVSLDLENQLLIANAMEPRAAVADYHPGSDELDVFMTSQNPHLHRLLMSGVIGHPEHKLRVKAPDVGGGFGCKIHHYADEALVALVTRDLERPVKWTSTRTEGYKTDAPGRGHVTTAELAMDDDANITGLRVDTKANLGAYLSTFAPAVPTYLYGTLLSGQYDIPAIHASVTGAYTNVPPVDAYRGAGRPEASFLVERLASLGAREAGVDPAEFRQKNFVSDDDFPYQTQVAVEYDSGEYGKPMEKALEAVDYDAFRERQEEAREEGRYLGIGFSCYIEACGLAPSELAGQLGAQAGLWESSLVRFHPGGTVTAFCGTSGHGQGHGTTYAQIVANELGIPYEDVEVVEGDTDEIPQGMGTYGSRSAAVGGSALVKSSQKLVEKAREIAAHQLEADPADVEFAGGEFTVSGTDRSLGIAEIAQQSYLAHDMPDDMEPGLEATSFYDPDNFVFPFGTHVAIVEVDPESGEIEFEKYVAVDDVGNQINPKIVEGQIHGGVAQGIGQALYEGAVYDGNAQLLTGSMQDYAVPKSLHIPDMETESTVTPCPHNPLGVKGVGEAGTIAAPQAVVNAVTDALQPFGVDTVEMPMTAERVWSAVNGQATADGGDEGETDANADSDAAAETGGER